MRALALATTLCVTTLCVLAGCAVHGDVAPREYLDEQTAATITVVREPWIFTTERTSASSDERGFLHLYAIDVNRMGEHRQYFAVLQSRTSSGAERAAPSLETPSLETPSLEMPSLELTSGAEALTFKASTEHPRALGLAEPIAPAYTLGAAWWYFPVDKRTLAKVAAFDELQAAMVTEGERTPFVLWRDGREELAELTTVLP